MAEDGQAKQLLERFKTIKSERSSKWDSYFQKLKDLMRPNSPDFTRKDVNKARRDEMIFESTAVWALQQFAAGVQAYAMPETERYMLYGLLDDELEDEDGLKWLEHRSDHVLRWWSVPECNGLQSDYETNLEMGLFGTGVTYQEWNYRLQCPLFRSYPLASCQMLENEMGMIDTLYREEKLTTRQVKQRFENYPMPKKIEECKDPQQKWTIIHAVYPRAEKLRNSIGTAKGMTFASTWLCEDTATIFYEGGYDDFPYHVARWEKIAGEVLGRSPAMTALSDVQMINELAKVDLKTRQIAMAPPLQVPNDAFISDLDMSPLAVNYREPGTEKAEPLITGVRPDVSEALLKMKQDAICRAFYTDLMMLRWKQERQTATEIMERRNDQLRGMGPMFGRYNREYIGQKARRSYNLGLKHGAFPPPPQSLRNKRMNVIFMSPATIAQRGSKIDAVHQYLNLDLLPLAQIDPTVTDVISVEEIAKKSATYRNVTRDIFRKPDEVAAIRDNRAKQQEAAMMAESMQAAAGAIRDIGAAGKDSPALLGLPAQ